jgi:bifunctional UDP-N-acetylglucosamine pyrophosphorylase / glucosamine-1-phosphate N-acetyltransferase
MKGYTGNKTLLPLIPGKTPFEGERPILIHILDQLPQGPRALVVHHRKEDVIEATKGLGVSYCDQPVTNGTGGAVLAARSFLDAVNCEGVIITMGDVPLVTRATYEALLRRLKDYPFVVLGFTPRDRKRYGLLETRGNAVVRIVEWEYRRLLSPSEQQLLRICNAGIYAARAETLRQSLDRLRDHPHEVVKERRGGRKAVREYFITDLVELLREDGLETGFVTVRDEKEVMGVDDPDALKEAQKTFKGRLEARRITRSA